MSDMQSEIDEILDQHDEAFRAFREASSAFDAAMAGLDTAMGGLRQTMVSVQAANHAQGEAIEAFRAANQAAVRLLRSQGR